MRSRLLGICTGECNLAFGLNAVFVELHYGYILTALGESSVLMLVTLGNSSVLSSQRKQSISDKRPVG